MKTYRFKINGNEYNIGINSISGNIADVTVNGTPYQVEMDNAAPQTASAPVQAAAPVQQTAAPVQAAPAAPAAPKPSGNAKAIESPLPGVIIDVKVKQGDVVKAGQVVAILEAMKMENEIQAETDGTVVSVNVSKGESILEGATIITVQ